MYLVATRRALLAIVFLPGPLFVAQPAYADVESPRVILTPAAKGLVVGPGMDARGRNLQGCEFVGQDLTGAVFDGCNLYDVRIEDCILKNASFRAVVFTGARLGSLIPQSLEGADFTDATMNAVQFTLYGPYHSVQLSPQQFMSTRSYKTKDLRQCVINGLGGTVRFDFRRADLREARIINGDFTESDFRNARLYGTRFENVRLTFEQLASTEDYQGHSLHVQFAGGPRGGLLGKWDFSAINLEGSDLGTPPPDADFTDARIGRCTLALRKSQLYSTRSYKEGNLTGLRVMGGRLSCFDLSSMNLTDCFFSHCKFAGTNFEDAVITAARFVTDKSVAESDRLTVEQIKSTWNYQHGRMEGIRLPDDLREALGDD